MEIQNACALVTGASAGIGAATARALAARGARVLLLARRAPDLEQVAGEIRARGGTARAYPVDLSDAAAVDRAFEQIGGAGEWPDVVVNSAGAGRWLYTEETSQAEAAQMMALPYLAAFDVTRRCLPEMLRRGRGHIVNINSPAARGGWPGAAGYTAARYALYGFTHALRLDLRGTGVHVTSVVPARVSSEYFARNAVAEARLPRIGRLVPTVTPEQVAQAVIWGVERRRREVVLPFMLRLVFALNAVAPRVMEELMVRSGRKRR
jgi:short-subunit dehydrogenase